MDVLNYLQKKFQQVISWKVSRQYDNNINDTQLDDTYVLISYGTEHIIPQPIRSRIVNA